MRGRCVAAFILRNIGGDGDLRHLRGESDIRALARAQSLAYAKHMTIEPIAQSHERLLIIDFGSQVTQLIARRLREQNVYCEIHPYQNVDAAFLAEFDPKAVIFSGGPIR